MIDCLHPVDAWKCGTVTARDGVRSVRLVFSSREAESYFRSHYSSAWRMIMDRCYMPQRCGKCSACQIRKRKDMSTRLANEASMYRDVCFLTLTYNDDNLPYTDLRPMMDVKKADLDNCKGLVDEKPILRGTEARDVSTWKQLQPTLVPNDITLFLKRLRKRVDRDNPGQRLRYFAVGEYGSKYGRPHYHLIIFGWRPSDLVIHEVRANYTVYRSPTLEKLWTYGYSTVGDVNAGVAKYCARYVTKKLDDCASYTNLPRLSRCPVFTRQSTRSGGMGAPFFDRFASHIMSVGYVTYRNGVNITKAKIPTTYLRRCRKYRLPVWLAWRDRAIQFHLDQPPVCLTFYSDLRRACDLDAELQRARAESEVF